MTKFDFEGESTEYRQARSELLKAEIALKNQVEQVAALRRQLPLGMKMKNYVFRQGPKDLSRNEATDFEDVSFADLFIPELDSLIVDHLMFAPDDDEPCVMCSMWADGYSAIAPHIKRNASFVLVAKAEIGKLRGWSRQRGWINIRPVSSHDNTFNADLKMENADGSQNPGVSVFTKDANGDIYHRYTIQAGMDDGNNRGIDLYTPVWHLMDLLPAGRGNWDPDHSYMDARN